MTAHRPGQGQGRQRPVKLKVDVNPNMGHQVLDVPGPAQERGRDLEGPEDLPDLGQREKRTVNLRKGTYRVWVNPKFGYQGAMSPNEVTLKR